MSTSILHPVESSSEPASKPLIDDAILQHPAIGVSMLTAGAMLVGHVLGGAALANSLGALIPGAALLIAGVRHLNRRLS